MLPSVQMDIPNHNYFITLEKIAEEEKTQIINLAFQRNQKDKLPLKKYYDGTGEPTLFELQGYRLKYDMI